jgi:hypothetical protein
VFGRSNWFSRNVQWFGEGMREERFGYPVQCARQGIPMGGLGYLGRFVHEATHVPHPPVDNASTLSCVACSTSCCAATQCRALMRVLASQSLHTCLGELHDRNVHTFRRHSAHTAHILLLAQTVQAVINRFLLRSLSHALVASQADSALGAVHIEQRRPYI